MTDDIITDLPSNGNGGTQHAAGHVRPGQTGRPRANRMRGLRAIGSMIILQ